MIWTSEVKVVGSIGLPNPSGQRILMMPFLLNEPWRTLPPFLNEWKRYIDAMVGKHVQVSYIMQGKWVNLAHIALVPIMETPTVAPPREVETVYPADEVMPIMEDSINMDRRIVFQDHLSMIESATTVAALSNEVNAALDNQLLTAEQKAAVRILRDKRMAALQPKKK